MDLEQLKLVLETINAAGGEAKEFGFWWLVARVIPQFLFFIFGMTALIVGARILNCAIRAERGAYAIALEVGHKVVAYWDHTDTARVIEIIRAIKDRKGHLTPEGVFVKEEPAGE